MPCQTCSLAHIIRRDVQSFEGARAPLDFAGECFLLAVLRAQTRFNVIAVSALLVSFLSIRLSSSGL
jgi:hypothetical protein